MKKLHLSACIGACFLAGIAVKADHVLIDEIMFHPGLGKPGEAGYVAEDTLKEYIELYNPGTNSVSLKGWQLSKGVKFTFPDVALAPKGYLVIAADADIARFKANYQKSYALVVDATVVGGWSGSLRNNGDTIELDDSTGKQIDSVSYFTEGDWALKREGEGYPGQPTWWRGWQWVNGADAGGKSLELINLAESNQHGQNWSASLNDGGTPGGPNSVAADTIAPVILDVIHAPAVPKSTNAVTITARIAASTGSSLTVSLCHRLDGEATFTESPMFDDGQHGDGGAGDGVFGAILPPQVDQTLVEFYVKAIGNGGRTRTWPSPSDDQGTQAANALYQVDNTVYAGNQPIYRLLVPKAEWNTWLNLMDKVSNGEYSDPAMNATLVSTDGLGTDIRYRIGVRNRGAGTRAAHPHNMHLTFPGDRPWHNKTAWSLNTRTVHSQVAGNAINVAAGLPNTYGTPVQVRVNGVNLAHASPSGDVDSYQFGSYFAFQPYGKEWMEAHTPADADGNIYKGVWNFDGHSLKHSANLDYLGTDPVSYREMYSPNGPTDSTGPYIKQSNVSEDDWTDLMHLCQTLNQAPDATYLDELNQVANIDEWLNYFAVNSLLGNGETTFGTGVGDDYSMYRGKVDTRFQILPHDMDTTLGQGDTVPDLARSVFKACDIPAVNRLLKHPSIAPRYFAILKQQADTTFSAAKISSLMDEVLGGWVENSYIEAMKQFVATRRANVLAQIAQGVTVTNNLAVTGGYPSTTSATVSLGGNADAIRTRTVLVNGVSASWVAWQAAWSASKIPLHPGLNRIVVQALDENQIEIDNASIMVWRDTGAAVPVAGGALTADTRWTLAGGPYLIQSSLTVNKGATLTIDAGAVVYLASGVNITVADGGRIVAEGTNGAEICFASPPGSTTSWGGFIIKGSPGSVESRFSHVYFVGNSATCIEVSGGTIYLDHANFGTTTHQYLALDGSSFLVSNCVFPSSATGFELAHGTGGIKAGGRGIVRECYFGTTTGYNDIMDFTGGNRPGEAIIQYYNNVFVGGSDDILDLDGTDAWIEGNIFLHVHRNGAPDSSSAISGGDYGSDTSQITIVGNLFFDCDNVATAKQGNFFTLFNNTMVHITKTGGEDFDSGVVNVRDTTPDLTTFGKGYYLQDNVIMDVESNKLVRNYDPAQTTVTFNNNILPVAWNGAGYGNVVASPRLQYMPQVSETWFTTWQQAQVMREWFRLAASTTNTEPKADSKGGVIPFGVILSGVPTGTTASDSATITVGPWASGYGIPTDGFPEGSGFAHYRWKLDGGEFSAETPASVPILLTNLANGPHTVTVIGKNDALYYQNDEALGPDAVVTTSAVWTVNKSLAGHVRLNEILAHNVSIPLGSGEPVDALELYNDGGATADLSGMSLAISTNAVRFVFPTGISLDAGAYLVVLADALTNAPGWHLGSGLDASGGSLYLLNRDGSVADSVNYGLQLPDLSIGRLADGSWSLTQPTLGAANVSQLLGDTGRLVVNEWLTDAQAAAASGFIELYNPNAQPTDLGGLLLANQSVGQPGLPPIAPLSFIGAHGFSIFYTDSQPSKGPRHLNFTLSSGPAAIGLFYADLTPIDVVFYGPQYLDVSQGRSPDGAAALRYLNPPTPGYDNGGGGNTTNVVTQTFPLILNTNVWRYNQTSIPEANWITPEYTADASWPSGAALLYVESDSKPWPKNTPLTLGRTTYYFRSHFRVTNDLAGAVLNLSTIIDDGAVYYINGQEVLRLHMPAGEVSYGTFASSHESALEGPYTISVTNVHAGDNVMAVEVHQVDNSSSDIVFGLSLEASLSVTNTVTNNVSMPVTLNEVLAHNVTLTNAGGIVSDWIELRNSSNVPFNLAGMSLTDDPAIPRKWVFPEGSALGADGLQVVMCNGSAAAATNNTGFSLKAEGGAVFLFDSTEREGKLLDTVEYGLQAPDWSIGRVSGQPGWVLTVPTPGTPNQIATLGNASHVKINEWMASPSSGSDWFELYNPESSPVSIGAFVFTDDLTKPLNKSLPALSFLGVGQGAFAKFVADSSPGKGANHVNFKLSASGDAIILLTPTQDIIDQVTFAAQTADVSQGRLPDGGTNIVFFPNAATPGASNVQLPPVTDTDGDGMPDAWETAHGLNPNDPKDALLDSDHDGLTNLQEYLAGTDPQDPASTLKASVMFKAGQPVTIQFNSVPGKTYSVQFTDVLSPNAWQNLRTLTATAGETIVSVSDTSSTGANTRFYRVRLEVPIGN